MKRMMCLLIGHSWAHVHLYKRKGFDLCGRCGARREWTDA